MEGSMRDEEFERMLQEQEKKIEGLRELLGYAPSGGGQNIATGRIPERSPPGCAGAAVYSNVLDSASSSTLVEGKSAPGLAASTKRIIRGVLILLFLIMLSLFCVVGVKKGSAPQEQKTPLDGKRVSQ